MKLTLLILTITNVLCPAEFAFAHDDSRRLEGHSEPLLGYQPYKSGIVFQVNSGGCTEKEDFRIVVRQKDGVKIVELIRIQPDPCRPFLPMGERIRFSYEEIGLTPSTSYSVVNRNGIVNGWIWNNENKAHSEH